ncbi:hypothetical protein SAMN05421676_12014 [Salinibacillus kushneri]|uniref:Uncharacterized protein n=1 Tax=Salinibacillus kushneri TaxID=237682 RepID=A0A1I0JGS1_9BACI|nr:hypothetical protein [Salinibacillus kushneri]SEU09444.1 hypothetical protein SAMN05421676_12014 [Salinibacillus kushneri]
MTFNEVMALIMPSVIGLLFYSKIIQRSITWFEVLSNLALLIVITNSICYGLLIFIFNRTTLLFSILFTMKYSILATLISVVIAFIYRFIELNVKIKVKVESQNEKNN